MHKSLMAFRFGCGTFESCYFHHITCTFEYLSHIMRHVFAYLGIIGAYIGGILIRSNLPVDEDDGYPPIVGFGYDRRQLLGLIGRYDKQVYPFIDKLPYILYLLLIIIIR